MGAYSHGQVLVTQLDEELWWYSLGHISGTVADRITLYIF